MNNKIFQSLKQTFSSKFGVGDEVLQGYADSLAATGLVTEENLATVVQGQESALRAYQASFDRLRTAKAEAEKKAAEFEAKAKGGPPKEEPVTPDIETLLKPYLEKVNSLENEIRSTRHTDTLKSMLHGKVPEAYYTPFIQGRVFNSEEELTTHAAKIEADYKSVQQSIADEWVKQGGVPGKGNGVTNKGELSAQEIEAFAKVVKPKTI